MAGKQRVHILQGGLWDESVVQRCLGVPPLDLPPVMHPVLTIDGFVEQDATSWLAHVYARGANEEDQQCPACGYTGKAIGTTLEYGVEADHYDRGVVYRSRMGVAHFECSVCDLELTDQLEVMAAGLPTEIDYVDEDYEPEHWPV